MADPRGINPQTQHTNEPPSPNVSTRRNDDDGENAVNTVAGLKTSGGSPAPGAGGTVTVGHFIGAVPPRNLEIGIQKALKELNVSPGSILAVTAIDSRYSIPDSVKFAIPDSDGKWSLSVNQDFIGNGQGQVSTGRWANVAKKLGQSTPLAAPVHP